MVLSLVGLRRKVLAFAQTQKFGRPIFPPALRHRSVAAPFCRFIISTVHQSIGNKLHRRQDVKSKSWFTAAMAAPLRRLIVPDAPRLAANDPASRPGRVAQYQFLIAPRFSGTKTCWCLRVHRGIGSYLVSRNIGCTIKICMVT